LGRRASWSPYEGGFWGLKLLHYALPAGQPASKTDVQPLYPMEVAITREMAPMGYESSASCAQPGDTLLSKLYWHTFSLPTGDCVLSLRLYDAATPDFRRLLLVDSAGDVLDNRIVLDRMVRVEAP
jgi:hypothetical protein